MDHISDDKWAAAAFAAKQPRGSLLWETIIRQLVREAEQYLAFWNEVKS